MHFRIACMKNSFLTASSSISNFHCSRSKSCSFRIHLLEPNVYCKCFKKRNVDLLTKFLKKFTVKFLVLLSIRDDIFVKYLSGFFITFIKLHIFFYNYSSTMLHHFGCSFQAKKLWNNWAQDIILNSTLVQILPIFGCEWFLP